MSTLRAAETEPQPRSKPFRKSKKLWIIVGIIAIALVTIASIVYVANRPGTASQAPAGPNVTIWDTGFCSYIGNCDYSPVTKSTTVGTTITWTNTGGQPHTVTECTSADNSNACPNGIGSSNSTTRTFDSNTQYSSGFKTQLYTFTFNLSPGTYYYYCTLHPWMHGTVSLSQ